MSDIDFQDLSDERQLVMAEHERYGLAFSCKPILQLGGATPASCDFWAP